MMHWGSLEDISYDLNVNKEAKVLDLYDSEQHKLEIICENVSLKGAILCALPGTYKMPSEKATLLGSF